MAKYLKVTLIDVGWGDSILVEASDSSTPDARPRFMLVDSNDSESSFTPSYTFLRKHFGGRENEFDALDEKPFFDAVVLSHDHADHGSGLKRIMKKYGTQNFWYPKVVKEESTIVAYLQSYANHHMVNIDHENLDTSSPVFCLGDAEMRVLWPRPGRIESDPNNNSLVLAFSMDDASFLLTGDAEGKVWKEIKGDIPLNTKFFKVPHHGSRNGTVYGGGCPWLERISEFTTLPELGISCHPTYPNRYEFPHAEVIYAFEEANAKYYRTDHHYHVTVTYYHNEQDISVKYAHV